MKTDLIQNLEDRSWDGIVLPVAKGALKNLALSEIGELEAVRRQGAFAGNQGELYQFTTLRDGKLCRWFLAGLGETWGLEEMLEGCAAAWRQCGCQRPAR